MEASRCRMHAPLGSATPGAAADRVLLPGQPNVGKSLLFNRLTGARTTVSNYPGTSVDLSTGTADLADRSVTMVDTPGIYSLAPVTEDERVTRELVLAGDATLVHVIEARNLERSLPLTLQLRATGRPLVGTFFLFFSLIEDSGYLPRLSLLVDRGFKGIGLNGRAVITMVLGFACDTMATMVTRTLETRRERVLSTVLLALAIPCSAQLGVILAVLAGQPTALTIWGLVVLGSFLLVGAAGARILPGTPATFHMELPPMRMPRPSNVIDKTASRVHWYFLEVLPLFLLASVLLWAGDHTGLLELTLDGLGPVVGALGRPPEAASVLLFGFFRRDYGAAGLFDLHGAGILDPVQLTVAAVTLTLFIPYVAQFLMMWKERGWRTAVATAAFTSGFALSVGSGLNLVLRGLAPWS